MPLHVVFIWGWSAVAVVLCGSTRAARFDPAEAAEQTSTQKEQHAGPPTHKDACTQLPLLRSHHQGVVEVSHHDVRRPADGDDHQEAGQQQAYPGHQADLGLGVFVLHTGGEVGAAEEDEEAEAAEHAADDGHGPGGLQVGGQHQQGVVVLALLLAGTLHHTLHPQARLSALLTQTEEVQPFHTSVSMLTVQIREFAVFFGLKISWNPCLLSFQSFHGENCRILGFFITWAVTMLDPVKDDTFQRGTAQHTIVPIKPRTPRPTHTIWTPTAPILQKDKVEKIHEEKSIAAPLLLFVDLPPPPADMQTFFIDQVKFWIWFSATFVSFG